MYFELMGDPNNQFKDLEPFLLEHKVTIPKRSSDFPFVGRSPHEWFKRSDKDSIYLMWNLQLALCSHDDTQLYPYARKLHILVVLGTQNLEMVLERVEDHVLQFLLQCLMDLDPHVSAVANAAWTKMLSNPNFINLMKTHQKFLLTGGFLRHALLGRLTLAMQLPSEAGHLLKGVHRIYKELSFLVAQGATTWKEFCEQEVERNRFCLLLDAIPAWRTELQTTSKTD